LESLDVYHVCQWLLEELCHQSLSLGVLARLNGSKFHGNVATPNDTRGQLGQLNQLHPPDPPKSEAQRSRWWVVEKRWSEDMEATNWQQRLTKKISLVGRRNPKKSTKDIKRQAQTGPPSGKSLVNAP